MYFDKCVNNNRHFSGEAVELFAMPFANSCARNRIGFDNGMLLCFLDMTLFNCLCLHRFSRFLLS